MNLVLLSLFTSFILQFYFLNKEEIVEKYSSCIAACVKNNYRFEEKGVSPLPPSILGMYCLSETKKCTFFKKVVKVSFYSRRF